MPAVDLVAHVDGLWADHEENTAQLLEHIAYLLGMQWADRTVDPDEAAERRAEFEAAGLKPPAHPPVVPMARRPWRHQQRRIDEYIATTTPYRVPEPTQLSDHEVIAAFAAQFA